MLFGLLLTLGVAVLSVALRSYQTTFAQKLGALGVLIASFLAVYFITGNAVKTSDAINTSLRSKASSLTKPLAILLFA